MNYVDVDSIVNKLVKQIFSAILRLHKYQHRRLDTLYNNASYMHKHHTWYRYKMIPDTYVEEEDEDIMLNKHNAKFTPSLQHSGAARLLFRVGHNCLSFPLFSLLFPFSFFPYPSITPTLPWGPTH